MRDGWSHRFVMRPVRCAQLSFTEDAPILDTFTPRETRGMLYEAMMNATGVEFLGECDGLVWFLDPVTRSTHTLPLDQATAENIEAVLKESRVRFRRKSTFMRAMPCLI